MSAAPTVDIAIGSDRHQFAGVLALVRSVLSNTGHPEAVSFHLVTGPGEKSELLALMRRSFPRPDFRYEIREFHPEFPALARYIRAADGVPRDDIPYRAAAINCSRFYLGHLFPEVDKILYLDTDIIVQGDVAELYRQASLERHDLAVVTMEGWGVRVDEQSPYFSHIDFERPGFNAGVFVARLDKWKRNGVVSRLEHWMDLWSSVQKKHSHSLFYFGSQPVMILAFYGNYQELPRKWNVHGLGWKEKDLSESVLREAGILHWTGPGKPWKSDGLYKEYWEKYAG